MKESKLCLNGCGKPAVNNSCGCSQNISFSANPDPSSLNSLEQYNVDEKVQRLEIEDKDSNNISLAPDTVLGDDIVRHPSKGGELVS